MNERSYYTESVGAQAGNTLPTSEPKPIPRLDGPATHLEEMLKGMQELRTRLEAVADRLGGTVPEPVDNSGQTGNAGGGIAARYSTIADNYSNVLRKLFGIVERLEKL